MEEVFDYDEALAKAIELAAESGLYHVIVPVFFGYYTVASYNDWLFSSDGDYVLMVDAWGNEIE